MLERLQERQEGASTCVEADEPPLQLILITVGTPDPGRQGCPADPARRRRPPAARGARAPRPSAAPPGAAAAAARPPPPPRLPKARAAHRAPAATSVAAPTPAAAAGAARRTARLLLLLQRWPWRRRRLARVTGDGHRRRRHPRLEGRRHPVWGMRVPGTPARRRHPGRQVVRVPAAGAHGRAHFRPPPRPVGRRPRSPHGGTLRGSMRPR
mmetsp:Transcript_73227/g.228414  ORF Transcript_73227/g.228414 Transcript_73227/m.228414 type:complete len:211 (+) Transcript_73227:227-859(+)